MSLNAKPLGKLIELMNAGQLVLPEIQRDFVWRSKDVYLLFDSLYRELPIGDMLVWKAKTPVPHKTFRARSKKGLSFDQFYGYLLDGQQRLSSVKLVMDRDENFPLMFSLWHEDEEDPFFWPSRKERENPWYISVADVFEDLVKPYELIEKLKTDENFVIRRDTDRIFAIHGRLRRILDYPIGIIEFENPDYRTATQLFIRFNSTGKKLKQSDLAASELALTVPGLVSKGINGACRKYSPSFTFTSTFLIQCLAVAHMAKFNLREPEDIWSKESGKADERALWRSWEKAEKGLGRTIEFLTGTVRWDSDSWLPSINSIIPLVFLQSHRNLSSTERKRACRWLLHANLHAIFSGSVHTEMDRLLKGLKKEPSVEKLYNLTKKRMGKIEAGHFETNRKSGAAMSFFISMLRNNNAVDWIYRTPLNGRVIGHNAELQVHHFFPQALLRSKGYLTDKINTFANYTIVNKNTNLNIKDEEPFDYLSRNKIRKADLSDQFIPLNERLWRVDKYEEFLQERRKLLAKSANSL